MNHRPPDPARTPPTFSRAGGRKFTKQQVQQRLRWRYYAVAALAKDAPPERAERLKRAAETIWQVYQTSLEEAR